MATADELQLWSAALRRAAAQLDAIATARASAARQARVDWSGPSRSRFDSERARRDGATAVLAGRCRRLASACDVAAVQGQAVGAGAIHG
jgi:hypothetical protein